MDIQSNQHNRPLVLVIAGLDSGGGAGVTADVISVHDQGAWAMPIVTALTCQSLDRVTLVQTTEVEVFKESIKLAVEDWQDKIQAIKIGLITSQKILDAVLECLDTCLKDIPVVWDPVLTATAGRLDSADLKANLSKILAHTTIFTPNIPEALELASWKEEDLYEKGGVLPLCDCFLNIGAKAVYLKGGHSISNLDASDIFKSQHHAFIMHNDKKPGLGAHGGGCALSSALAGLIATGYELHDAAIMAKVYVTKGIFNPDVAIEHKRPPIGHSPLSYDLKYMPTINEENFPFNAGPFAKCPQNLGIYVVVDSADWVERLLALGVKTVQLRIKTDVHDDENNSHLCEEIKRACFLGKAYHARVFIDDHYKLAIKYGAYGVHLGMEDLQTADLDLIRDSGLRLGVSTHGIYEICKVLTLQPSYIALGHIFPTQTKEMPSKPQGLHKLHLEAQMLKGIYPTVAIGGIKLKHAKEILELGADSIAVVTAITKAPEPCVEVQKWISICRTGPAEHYDQQPASWLSRQDEQHKHAFAWHVMEEPSHIKFTSHNYF